MRINYFLTSTLAAATMLVASCTTPQLAQNAPADDVYNSNVQARVYKPAPVQTYRVDTSNYDDSKYTSSNQNYDMDYQSRIDRFYYGNTYRPYYDDYYNYYGYNSWYNPFNLSLGFGYGYGYNSWYNPYSSWSYYGSPYRWNTWGPYSYHNPWYGGGFGGGYYGGGFGGGYWGNNVVIRDRNYAPRPMRGYNGGSTSGGGRGTNVGYTPSRPSTTNTNMGRPTRPGAYNPSTGGNRGSSSNNGSSSRPTRGSNERPASTGSTPSREPSVSRPTYSPPSNSGSSSSGSSSSGSSRPTRSGGRG